MISATDSVNIYVAKHILATVARRPYPEESKEYKAVSTVLADETLTGIAQSFMIELCASDAKFNSDGGGVWAAIMCLFRRAAEVAAFCVQLIG